MRAILSAIRSVAKTFVAGVNDFIEDGCPSMAAALAYFALFSLPPLLVVLMTIGESLVEAEAVRMEASRWIWRTLGPNAAREVERVLWTASRPGGPPGFAAGLSIVVLGFSSTTAFAQLQDALNRAWDVRRRPDRAMWKAYLFKRLLSFGLLVLIGLAILASMAMSTLIVFVAENAPIAPWATETADAALSFAMFTTLLAVLFRFAPDAEVAWRHAFGGAAVTAVLFIAAKRGLTFYLSHSDLGSAYGSAGSLALLLFWFYAAAAVFLFGAELTHAWAAAHAPKTRR